MSHDLKNRGFRNSPGNVRTMKYDVNRKILMGDKRTDKFLFPIGYQN